MSDEPALQPDLAVGLALSAVVHNVLYEARAALERPGRIKPEAVHDFRKAIKRWRALLRLLGPFVGDEARALRDEAGELARKLRGARDTQAALDALADLDKSRLALSERSLATIRTRMAAMQEAEQTTVGPKLRRDIVQALQRAGDRVEDWPLDDLTFDDIAQALTRGYRAVQKAIPADWHATGPETLHDLRKRVVAHRHQMDIVEPLWPRFNHVWIGEAQRLRDRLGKHQDLLVLESLVAPGGPLARWRSQLTPAIAQRKSEHVTAARHLATRLFVDKPNAVRRRLTAMWDAAGERALA